MWKARLVAVGVLASGPTHVPVEVDRLCLRTWPHTRRLFRLEDGAWSAMDINP